MTTDAGAGRPGRSSHSLTPATWEAVLRYANGAFPMDDESGPPQLPWYTVENRFHFSLSDESRAFVRRKVRRDLRRHDDLQLMISAGYEESLELCAEPPPGEERWITPRLADLYRDLHAAGFAHSLELRRPDGGLAACIVGILIGRAALLESMRHRVPGAGNALLSRALDFLAGNGFELCDIQLATDHTARMGCRSVPRDQFELQLAKAVTQRPRLPGTRVLQAPSPPGR